jgi:hypothetical protein
MQQSRSRRSSACWPAMSGSPRSGAEAQSRSPARPRRTVINQRQHRSRRHRLGGRRDPDQRVSAHSPPADRQNTGGGDVHHVAHVDEPDLADTSASSDVVTAWEPANQHAPPSPSRLLARSPSRRGLCKRSTGAQALARCARSKRCPAWIATGAGTSCLRSSRAGGDPCRSPSRRGASSGLAGHRGCCRATPVLPRGARAARQRPLR